MSQEPFFDQPSGTVRFWVEIDGQLIGASIGTQTLHYRYQPTRHDDDPMVTYAAHAAEIEAAVRRRVAGGSRHPVMLRDHDMQPQAEPVSPPPA
ncbi:DUF1488 family protein [Aquincola sp. S2]|uniref:DUF1488 family protein n=1 Tax=Pseudaquabacterium terrae TaxID=2732868 RepID=A0ABX2EEU3_9BURK|nr:DUF1488 family protein [Aquabacterium terrae]NRF67121.1 DUF1488 family protein [Aquabacterium terrae]